MPRKRTYGLDSDTIAYAARVKAGSGVSILPEPLKQINDFVLSIKSLGLWNSVACWPLRSMHNAGKGTVIYGLGGLGNYNGVINDQTLWSPQGIVTRSGSQRPTFDGFTYVPNNFNGTFCCVSGLLYTANQRIVGHNSNFGQWLGGTVSGNTQYASYYDTVRGAVNYNTNGVSNNNRDTVSFVGMSRNLSGNTTYFISNPNITTGSTYYTTSVQTLTGLTTGNTYTFMQGGINSFLMCVSGSNFQLSDYKNIQTILRTTLFKDNVFQWVY